jgi:hypothetical protein
VVAADKGFFNLTFANPAPSLALQQLQPPQLATPAQWVGFWFPKFKQKAQSKAKGIQIRTALGLPLFLS